MITLQSAHVERFAVDGAFIISRGEKTDVDVVVCEVTDGTHVGRGEGTPIYYEGETAELCVEAINMRCKQNRPLSREDLLDSMMEGAARNALDCALWDLESKQTGKPVWELAGLPEPKPLVTAYTISLGEPEVMEADARKAAETYALLKVKLNGENDRARVAAVRVGAPNARIIVDANEAWDELDIVSEAMAMHELGVELIEQPVSAGFEDELMGVETPMPLCADESCHTSEDIERVEDCFQVINVKLDKTGGLTEALRLVEKAKEADMGIMVGCMLSTSLAIGPAFALAQVANWADLDGPALLKKDREGGFKFEGGMISQG
ncbi:N-acetyl-D-Glu racemase DgcA [Sphingorhabdus sp. Alg239-R122]|uniref:N-acetyl-D-Glu racemase DgcA n=1 Tax=Sphingorhabdus sp. Alg239-R122 TaxID=2305989 RepID=UPI0013DAADC8|nr:N-acetyl-D-Glu racemase DgcA [Sphingorhabdus sp. Alg239-R122]